MSWQYTSVPVVAMFSRVLLEEPYQVGTYYRVWCCFLFSCAKPTTILISKISRKNWKQYLCRDFFIIKLDKLEISHPRFDDPLDDDDDDSFCPVSDQVRALGSVL